MSASCISLLLLRIPSLLRWREFDPLRLLQRVEVFANPITTPVGSIA
jgi:hypothetical protein